MEEKPKKRSWLERLTGGRPARKSPCCGGFEIEEIHEDQGGRAAGGEAPKSKKGSCCG